MLIQRKKGRSPAVAFAACPPDGRLRPLDQGRPPHRLVQRMDHDSRDTTRISVASTRQGLQEGVERIAWA